MRFQAFPLVRGRFEQVQVPVPGFHDEMRGPSTKINLILFVGTRENFSSLKVSSLIISLHQSLGNKKRYSHGYHSFLLICGIFLITNIHALFRQVIGPVWSVDEVSEPPPQVLPPFGYSSTHFPFPQVVHPFLFFFLPKRHRKLNYHLAVLR